MKKFWSRFEDDVGMKMVVTGPVSKKKVIGKERF